MENIELQRLEKVAEIYFSSLSNLAELIGKHRQTFYSYKKRPGIGRKVIDELKDKVGINPDYIKSGKEPMLINDDANKYERKVESNISEVIYTELINLPDIKTLTPNQMRQIKEWATDNIPKIDRILETVESTEGE
jgi:hypothetical protein